ncbi:hypothetical protein [Glaciihabitans sp. dw_435]|uniref:hypothetical protein n=1 Tax=Glaciihabitans sp. dw_435 TaxID=2720081 RepID=UPI001BD6BF92|nr:hypothetical protein [Glaciihabitans sp. dw_435]
MVGRDPNLSVDTVASRSEAYVYGNILVLAALATLTEHDIQTGHAALLVAGTALSTFVAHVLAHFIGHQIRAQGRDESAHLRAGVRNAVPIATSGAFPTILLLAGMWHWLPGGWSLGLAIASIVLRFFSLGTVLASLSGKRSSLLALMSGIGLGVVGVIVVTLKVVLTH